MVALTAPPRYFDRGNGARLLQPANQAALAAVPTDLATALVAIAAHQAALIAAGIMKSS